MIWKKSKVDRKGRVVLPQSLRRELNLSNGSHILWISVVRGKQKNIFMVEVGVDNK